MVRQLRNGSTVATLLVAAAWPAVPAAASSLPTLLANTKCARPCTKLLGIYEVRPREVVLAEAFGGDLVLKWSSWTSSAAIGSGTSTSQSTGGSEKLRVSVRASLVKSGTFTRLTLTATGSNGKPDVETLHLGHAGGSPGWTT